MTKVEANYRAKLVTEFLQEKFDLLKTIVFEEKDLESLRLTLENAKAVQRYLGGIDETTKKTD